MARLITNSPKPVVRVNVAQTNYRGILNLAQRVHDAMTISSAFFTTPTPTMMQLQTDIDGLALDLASLGTKTNKGGKAALDQVQLSSFTVFNDLTQLAAYVQTLVSASTSAALQRVLVSRSGFAAKKKRAKTPLNQFVKGGRQSNSKQFPQTLRRLKWKKPLGNYSKFKPVSYNIYGSLGPGNNKRSILNFNH